MKPDFEMMAEELDVPQCNSESIADALRAAYAAGLERAAEIADAYEGSAMVERCDVPSLAVSCEIADLIRAEKEADHG